MGHVLEGCTLKYIDGKWLERYWYDCQNMSFLDVKDKVKDLGYDRVKYIGY